MICPSCHKTRENKIQCEHCDSLEQISQAPANSLVNIDIPEASEPAQPVHPPMEDPFDEDSEATGIKKEILDGKQALENKYIIGKEIGRGGMGFVYQALDLTLKRVVAIKVLPPKYNQDQQIISRFLREARAMAMLDHPNIVPVYSIGNDEGLHYFVMKYLEGKTISKIIQRQNKQKQPEYTIAEIIHIIGQICDGLAHAHAKQILHRDIKPSNLMVGENLKTTVMDFGIVKMVEKNNIKTQHGKIFGTPEYMSPEQAMGKGDYFASSDIYALAVVLYELICGELPFQAEGPIEMILQHIRQPFPGFKGRGQGKPERIEAVIAKAMAKDPLMRYQDILEFKKALIDAEHSQPKITLPPVFTPSLTPPVVPPPSDQTLFFAPKIEQLQPEIQSTLQEDQTFQQSAFQFQKFQIKQVAQQIPKSPTPIPSTPLIQAPTVQAPTVQAPTVQAPPPNSEAQSTNRAGHYKNLPIKRVVPKNNHET